MRIVKTILYLTFVSGLAAGFGAGMLWCLNETLMQEEEDIEVA